MWISRLIALAQHKLLVGLTGPDNDLVMMVTPRTPDGEGWHRPNTGREHPEWQSAVHTTHCHSGSCLGGQQLLSFITMWCHMMKVQCNPDSRWSRIQIPIDIGVTSPAGRCRYRVSVGQYKKDYYQTSRALILLYTDTTPHTLIENNHDLFHLVEKTTFGKDFQFYSQGLFWQIHVQLKK